MTRTIAPAASWFSSSRERRLWLWTLAVVVAIYSTLGLARTMAVDLRDRAAVDNAFLWSAVLIVAATSALALKIRPRGAEIGVGLGVVAVYAMIFVRMALPETRTHLMEYGVVALFVHEALLERADHGRLVPFPAVMAVMVTALIGTLDELIQVFVPSRVFDPVDIMVNITAAVLAILASLALRRARRGRQPAPSRSSRYRRPDR